MRLPAHALRRLANHPAVERLHLVVSSGAAKVLRHEIPGPERDATEALLAAAGLGGNRPAGLVVHGERELEAEISSGSYRLDATIVLPCSSGTLGALAAGAAANLVQRAGLVALKERWPLILGFRETPLSLVHIENMRRVSYAGATIVPPIPAFYVGGEKMERFLDAYVLRLMDIAGVPSQDGDDLRWEGGRVKS